MKIYRLVYNKVLGMRVLFPKLGVAYDIPTDMFMSYFQDLDSYSFECILTKSESLRLKLVGDLFVTDAELENKYKVVSVEDDSTVAWLYAMYKLDPNMDNLSKYVYKSDSPQLDNGSPIMLRGINPSFGNVLVVSPNSLDYCIKINEMRKYR